MIPDLTREPIEVSPGFRSAIVAKILELERNAARDERVLRSLTHADQRRRQQMLVDTQLEKAYRLREMLALVTLRSTPRRRERVV